MINPYFSYIFSFCIALLIYTFGWSEIYPSLGFTLLAFLFITFLIHFIIGRQIHKNNLIFFKSLPLSQNFSIWITLFIYLLWSMEFIYEGGIPLLKIILNQPYDYRLFGIPSLHVFVVTFSSFYTVYLFHLFLSHKSKRILLLYLLNLIASLLIYNRGMLFFNVASSLFVYLIFLKTIPIRKIIYISLGMVPLLFIFGFLGSLRVSKERKEPYNNEIFMEIGQATNGFKQSIIPKEYFWTYMYVSSPLANLALNTNDHWAGKSLTIRTLAQMFTSEVLPDFLSKRINRAMNLVQPSDKRIPGPFNVSTVYSRSYSYAGWWGIVAMAIVLVLFPWLFFKLLPTSSDYFLSGWAILCTMYFFLFFDNTLRFTGLSLQLSYPLLLNWLSKSKLQKN